MNTKVASQDEKKQMMTMLQKFEAQNAESDDNASQKDQIADLYERMAGIDLDDSAEVWERLTASERARFQDTAHLASLLVRLHTLNIIVLHLSITGTAVCICIVHTTCMEP